jgi:hypothetical protein
MDGINTRFGESIDQSVDTNWLFSGCLWWKIRHISSLALTQDGPPIPTDFSPVNIFYYMEAELLSPKQERINFFPRPLVINTDSP